MTSQNASDKDQQSDQPLTEEQITKILDQRMSGFQSSIDKKFAQLGQEIEDRRDEREDDEDEGRKTPISRRERELSRREDAVKKQEIAMLKKNLSDTLGVPEDELTAENSIEMQGQAMMWKMQHPDKAKDASDDDKDNKKDTDAKDDKKLDTRLDLSKPGTRRGEALSLKDMLNQDGADIVKEHVR